MIDAERREATEDGLAPGTRVEIRNTFDGRWSRGFEVVDAIGAGYVVRRLSDGETLPVAFDQDDIREERRKHGLWWA